MNIQFSAHPTRILFVLESSNLLSRPLTEMSPLRRLHDDDSECKIYIDSRDVESHLAEQAKSSAPQFIYFARKGRQFDGYQLVEKILSSGNICVGEGPLFEQALKNLNRPKQWIHEVLNHPFLLLVHNSEQALKKTLLQINSYKPDHFLSIAITGTNGKTSTTQILTELLTHHKAADILQIGTLGIACGKNIRVNPYPTMPDFPNFLQTFNWAGDLGCRTAVFEATSIGLVEERMGGWLVDAAIFTNISQDHLDYHKTMENYIHAKTLLFQKNIKENGTIVVNIDDPNWYAMAEKSGKPGRICIGYGNEKNKKGFFQKLQQKFSEVLFLNTAQRLNFRSGIKGLWRLENRDHVLQEARFSAALIGDFQIDNLSAAAACLVGLGIRLDQIVPLCSKLKGVPGRMQLVQAEGPTVIVDYAHSPDALKKVLTDCKKSKGSEGNLWVVFGCGGDRDASKRSVMGSIAKELADKIVVTSDNPRTEDPIQIIQQILKDIGNLQNLVIQPDRQKAIDLAVQGSEAKDMILIAGKGHENYQIIGEQKFPFDDVEVAKQSLKEKKK